MVLPNKIVEPQGTATSLSVSVKEQIKQLDNLVSNILVSNISENKEIKGILPFIKRTLEQFQLDHDYDQYDVFLESYKRTKVAIIRGKFISNMPVWLKRTSYNIVREWRKDKNRQEKIVQYLLNGNDTVYLDEDKLVDYAVGRNLEILINEVKALERKDYSILYLRIIKEYSWKEIGEYLFENELEMESNPKKREEKLRQKGKRIMEKIRMRMFENDGRQTGRKNEMLVKRGKNE